MFAVACFNLINFASLNKAFSGENIPINILFILQETFQMRRYWIHQLLPFFPQTCGAEQQKVKPLKGYYRQARDY